MSPAQHNRYFYEWGRVRDVRKAKGLPCTDSVRHELHLKALGRRKSSKDFTNRDLDRVLAVFLSITEPDNLRAQLRLIDQPEARQARAREACREIVGRLPQIREAADPALYTHNYLDSLARKVRKAAFDELDETGLCVLHGILKARLDGHTGEPQRPGDLRHAVASPEDLEKHNCAW